MKAEPTDIDREAARLFTVGRGMTYGRECAGSVVWNVSHGQDVEADAIDTDDPATVGGMLAQVEQAANHTLSEVADNGDDHRRPERRHAVMVWSARGGCERHEAAHGPTRGAALVAAMRQIRRGVTP